jgi:hypothetical protein
VYSSAAEWAGALARAAGRTSLPVKVMPRWQVRLAGLFDRDAREFAELLYQWNGPMLLDDTRTRKALPDWVPTPPEVSLAATLAWFKANP